MAKKRTIRLPINKLAVGLMIDLNLPWTKHPFVFSKFKINSRTDIAIIKNLGINEVTVFPDQSDIRVTKGEQQEEETDKEQEALIAEQWQEKNKKLQEADLYRKKRSAVAKEYKEKATMVRRLTKELKTAPANAIRNAEELVNNLAEDFEKDNELLTNLVNLGSEEHTMYNHCINVTILAMTLAAAKGIKDEPLRLLARGALLHDVGKIDIPSQLTKKSQLSKAEKGVVEQHTLIGERICQRVENTPKEVLEVILKHHEYLDGSGYPKKIKAAEIPQICRIVTIANVYDNLCNPIDISKAMTPKIALATMYSKFKDKLDHELVQTFIAKMGVYPPGSVVLLNDESIGLVVCVDPKNMMNPEILLYNPDIPPLQALIINLAEHDELKIDKVLKPGEFPKRVYDYLGIQERIGFMVSQS